MIYTVTFNPSLDYIIRVENARIMRIFFRAVRESMFPSF